MTNQAYNYDNISDILKRYQTENLEKINFYGVITYLGTPKAKSTFITVVDQSCQSNEKLKINVFKRDEDIHQIVPTCQLGDIVRFHRLKIQTFNNQAQGVRLSYSAWTRFKRNGTYFNNEGNALHVTLEAQDEKIVSDLREWLKTNPQLDALFEAKISTRDTAVNLNEHELNEAAAAMHMQAVQSINFDNLNLYKFNTLKPDLYFDIICQVCSVNIHSIDFNKSINFISVWDGTNTNYAVGLEQEFKLVKQNQIGPQAYFSKSITEQTYHIYVFDEYVQRLNSIEPGDFILIRNGLTAKPTNIVGDFLIKIPGGGGNHNRTIVKVASHDLNYNYNCNDIVKSVINSINDKGKELKLQFMPEDEYKSYFQMNLQDDTLAEIMQNHKNTDRTAQQKQPTDVNKLLNDESIMYILTSDEDSRSSEENKENNSTRKLNTSSNEQINSQIPKQTLPETISPIKSQILNTLVQTMIESDETLHDPIQSIQTSTQKIFKKHKKIDSNEICDDIYKMQRLVNTAHFVPYLTCDLDYLKNELSMPFFNSLANLEQKCNKADFNFMRFKVIAKIDNYSEKKSQQSISSVFVNCKKCDYINFTPFSFGITYYSSTIHLLAADIHKQNIIFPNDENEINLNNAKNFSLNWLHSAMPEGLIMASQTNDSSPIMKYECPRCLVLKKNTITDDADDDNPQLLDYIYRFWFKLKDQSGFLDCCLVEADLAERISNINPVKFFICKNKEHEVRTNILKHFERRSLYTIDCFKLSEQSNDPNKIKYLFKIVDIEHIKPL